MKINVPYNFGDIVYLKTDPRQKAYEIIAVMVRPGPSILLEICIGGNDEITVYDFQVSPDKDILKGLLEADKNDDD